MISEDLRKKVLEQINHSGYPLELELIEKLRSSNNLVFPNISFQTVDSVICELDIVCLLQSEINEWIMGPVGISLIIECKKTNRYPWIFFEQVYDPLDGMGMLFKADYQSDFYDETGKLNPLKGCMNTIFSSHHYNENKIPTSRTYFELGKQDKDPSAIYKSIMNIFHGRQFIKNWFIDTGRSDKAKGRTHLNQYLIVIDGELIIAKRRDNNFDVENVGHVIITAIDTVSPQNYNLNGSEILIDVVTKDYFDEYQKIIEQEVRDFCSHLKVIYDAGFIKPSQTTIW